MPLLTVLAPGTRVEVEGMALPNAEIERVELRRGVNPVVYHLTWRDSPNGVGRRASYAGHVVTEKEPEIGAPRSGMGRMGDLGKFIEQAAGGQT